MNIAINLLFRCCILVGFFIKTFKFFNKKKNTTTTSGQHNLDLGFMEPEILGVLEALFKKNIKVRIK